VCRQPDVLGVDTRAGGENGFSERHQTNYTAEGVWGRLHWHHSLYNKCLYISDSSRRSVFYIGSPTLIITRTRRSHRVKARNLAISNRSRVSSAHTVTTVFIARQYADARYWYSKSVRPSARLSVTFRYQMKTAQHNRHSFFTIR